jgi:hypothetical protein
MQGNKTTVKESHQTAMWVLMSLIVSAEYGIVMGSYGYTGRALLWPYFHTALLHIGRRRSVRSRKM